MMREGLPGILAAVADLPAVCAAFECKPEVVRLGMPFDSDRLAGLVSEMVRCYGVSLVHNWTRHHDDR